MTSPYPMLSILGILFGALTIAAWLIWLERRLLALWQDRYGPNRVGPFRAASGGGGWHQDLHERRLDPAVRGQTRVHSGSGHHRA